MIITTKVIIIISTITTLIGFITAVIMIKKNDNKIEKMKRKSR
jgi:hypothetical protein